LKKVDPFLSFEDMSEAKKFIVDGYRFDSESGYEAARKELARINQVKKDYDLTDTVEIRRAYDMLVGSGVFVTPVGIGFMREMQRTLAKDPVQRKTLKAIPAPRLSSEEYEEFKNNISDKKELNSQYEKRLRNHRIVIIFMAALVGVLFIFTIVDRNMGPELARQQLTDEYASWKEELSEEQDRIDSTIDELKKKFPEDAEEIDKITAGRETREGTTADGQEENSGS